MLISSPLGRDHLLILFSLPLFNPFLKAKPDGALDSAIAFRQEPEGTASAPLPTGQSLPFALGVSRKRKKCL